MSILQIITTTAFFVMFALLLFLLWRLAQNLKIYGEAWLTLISVYKQNADSLQKASETNQTLARALEKR